MSNLSEAAHRYSRAKLEKRGNINESHRAIVRVMNEELRRENRPIASKKLVAWSLFLGIIALFVAFRALGLV